MTVALAHQAAASSRDVALREAAREAKSRTTKLAVIHVVEALDLDVADAYRAGLDDEVRALAHLVDHREMTGPVNLVGPDPLPQKQVVAELGRQLGRPSVVPAPAFALRAVLGEFAGSVTGSQRVVSSRLRENGFDWVNATIASAVASIV